MRPGKILIHGTGLIGASIGLGLAQAGWDVSGWDPDPEALAIALDRNAIDRATGSESEGLETADVVVLAGPPVATVARLGTIETKALVTDIASLKAPIVAAGSRVDRFVGGHPMAGSAASGAGHASAHLFHGAKWVLCNDTARSEDIEAMSELVVSLGATPVVMSAQDHDRSVALVSHLPRVLASALVKLAGADPHALNVSAGSFRDLTRVAASGSEWWTEVLTSNAGQVGDAIADLQSTLGEIAADLDGGNRTGISTFLRETGETRSHLAAPAAEVRVVLFDRPGEIARVGRALEESAVDLRDLQLRHAEHGGGGILTLSVGIEEVAPLRAALDANGFELEAPG